MNLNQNCRLYSYYIYDLEPLGSGTSKEPNRCGAPKTNLCTLVTLWSYESSFIKILMFFYDVSSRSSSSQL